MRCSNRRCSDRRCRKKSASISRFDGGIVQGNQFPRRIILFREGILGISVYDLEHVAGALGAESEALLFDRNHSIPIFEYRSLFHELLDARFRPHELVIGCEISPARCGTDCDWTTTPRLKRGAVFRDGQKGNV
jgi:hypothetical protein